VNCKAAGRQRSENRLYTAELVDSALMTSLGVSATLRSTACNDGLPRAAGPRGIPRCTRRASVHRSLPPRKPAQRGPTSTTVRVNAFWFWNKSEAEPTAGGASVTTAAPLPSAEAARNNVSPAGGRFGEKTASSLAAAEPVVDDWQRLTNVSYYPNATSKFQASRWHVQKRLGQGSYGVVYLAEDLKTGNTHALKVLSKTRPKVDPQRVMWKLLNEIQLLGSVQSCPNVVRFHEVMEDDDRMYLVMDVCTGGTLQDLLERRNGDLLEAEAALAMADVMYFLGTCHRNQIVYADVKPANFMFAHPYEGLEMYRPPNVPRISGATSPVRQFGGQALGLGLKAIDMGCSKVVRQGTTLTKRMGTPAYFAPEVFSRSYTPKADLWSAGVLAHQLITGRFPYWKNLRGLSTQDVADCVLHKPVNVCR